jgi:predicted ATP-dependent protease
LTGEQGVVVPEANVRHLMLKTDVLDAIERGQFHVWSVRTIDQGIQLLTGVSAGTRQADGSYPEGTVHERVRRHLLASAERLAEYTLPRTRAASPPQRSNGEPADAQEELC